MAKTSSKFQRGILTTMLILVLLRGCETMTTLDPVPTGFNITGASNRALFGNEVNTAGDINGDGYGDLIISAPYAKENQQMAYVVYGGPTSSLLDINLGLTPLDPATTGFAITINATNKHYKMSVSTAGDIDNDGYDDIIFGVSEKDNRRGAAYVIYGGPKASMSNIDLTSTPLNPATTGFMISGNALYDWFGESVSTGGDINHDGYDDIVVGAFNKETGTGAVYVIYGEPRSSMSNIELNTTTLDPATTGFIVSGDGANTAFGHSVRRAGDINNDGYNDIIVGAIEKNLDTGAAYVIYGGPKSSSSNIDMSQTPLDPATTGFMISGVHTLDFLGDSVNTAGDINNDGYDDIIVGAPGMENESQRGVVFVIYGGPKSSMSNIDLKTTTLDPATTGFMISGNAPYNSLGVSVSTAGDINHDGYDDIIVGAPAQNLGKGAAYVIYGGPKSSMSNIDLQTTTLDPATTGFMISGDNSSLWPDWLGCSVSTAGDVNNDGFKDIIIGAQGKAFIDTGVAYVIYGGPKHSMKNLTF